MRRILVRLLLGLVVLVAAVLVLPPLWFAVFRPEVPELPAAGRRIAVGNGLAVNAVEYGSGPAVVLVHGLPGCAYDWTPLAKALAARGLHAIAYDRVGYGRSDGRRDDDFTIGANARELAGLLESEDLHDATVVGWSFGGPVSLAAARASDRIGRLVLVGSGGPSSDDARPPSISPLFRFAMIWVGAVPPVGGAIMRATSAAAFSDGPQPEWWLPQLAANFGAPNTRRTYREEIAAIGRSGDLGLDAVAQPILLIHGKDDRLAPFAIGEWLHRHAKRSELVGIEGGSHMLPVTHSDELADRIAAFTQMH